MLKAKTVLERAFELAHTGEFATRSQIGRALEKEGYTIADVSQLAGVGITRQLNALCRLARTGEAA